MPKSKTRKRTTSRGIKPGHTHQWEPQTYLQGGRFLTVWHCSSCPATARRPTTGLSPRWR